MINLAQAAPVIEETWFQVMNLVGWPTLFILGLVRGWWSMGPKPECDCGELVDPEWKAIALRSIGTNEDLATELRESRQQRRQAHS